MTIEALRVLLYLAHPVSLRSGQGINQRCGADITRATGLTAGSLSAIFTRFVGAQWMTVERETGDPRMLGRPLKKFYSLTKAGRAGLHETLASMGLAIRRG